MSKSSEVSYKLNYAANNNILVLQGLWVIVPIQTGKKFKKEVHLTTLPVILTLWANILCIGNHQIEWRQKGISKLSENRQLTMSVMIFFPKTMASPEVGVRRPTSIDIVVLFPAPLCPSKLILQIQHNKATTYVKYKNYLFYVGRWRQTHLVCRIQESSTINISSNFPSCFFVG